MFVFRYKKAKVVLIVNKLNENVLPLQICCYKCLYPCEDKYKIMRFFVLGTRKLNRPRIGQCACLRKTTGPHKTASTGLGRWDTGARGLTFSSRSTQNSVISTRGQSVSRILKA